MECHKLLRRRPKEIRHTVEGRLVGITTMLGRREAGSHPVRLVDIDRIYLGTGLIPRVTI